LGKNHKKNTKNNNSSITVSFRQPCCTIITIQDSLHQLLIGLKVSDFSRSHCTLSVCLSVTLCIVAKRYILQQNCLELWTG